MSLESSEKYLQAALGYLDLGMRSDAQAELESIDLCYRIQPEYLTAAAAIYYALKSWNSLQKVAQRLVDLEPQNVHWVVLYSFATRQNDSIEAAKAILLIADPKFPKEASIKYNLACYECQLGNLKSSKEYLNQAIRINSDWRLRALKEVDLEPLWDSM